MELKKIGIVLFAALSTFGTMSQVHAEIVEISDSSYFVRPVLRIGGGEIIEGIQENGAIEATNEQGVVGYSSSTVNLADGTVKMYSEEFAVEQGLQTFGSFGERITITNGAGTNWDVGFDIEGSLFTEGGGPLIEGVEGPNIFYDVGIAVYRAGQVNWSNFVGNPDFDPVLFEYTQSVDPIDSFSEFSEMDIFGSVALESDYEQFDIFAFTNMTIFTEDGDGLESYISDFTNTASFSQTFATGVDAFSSSGQFMGLSTPPPAVVDANTPSQLLYFMFGLSLLYVKRSLTS